jgi:hypothetical protein
MPFLALGTWIQLHFNEESQEQDSGLSSGDDGRADESRDKVECFPFSEQ